MLHTLPNTLLIEVIIGLDVIIHNHIIDDSLGFLHKEEIDGHVLTGG